MVRFFQFASSCLLGLTFAIALLAHSNTAQGASFKVLHSFSGGSDGCYPAAGVIIDGAGNLYGTTSGGDGNCSLGTVFKLARDGTETVLYNFTGGDNGQGPDTTLVMDKKGNLYGSTIGGGSIGCGVIFEVTPNKKERTAHDFANGPNDGCTSQGTLIVDAKGNLYGTTSGGGKYGNGTVFKLSPDGTLALLHSFNKMGNGVYPFAGLLMNPAGDFYGTAGEGGSRRCDFYCGTVFGLAPNGKMTVLYKFKGPPNDGSNPEGVLLVDKAGKLYGTLPYGGSPGCEGKQGCGAVFQLAPDGGVESILHFFTGKSGDGGNPFGGLIADNAGNLYGATAYGGGRGCTVTPLGCGTVFEIGTGGTETVLHSFGKGKNGANPAGLVSDGGGNFYSTTAQGGADGFGTVFELTP